uniref:Uncharacterized protein n=1 Tax=Gossypium raimondii TaxID=29730 RepID=A0A0D2VDZ3_GOSRA|nr:hypothetical protein B456_010G224700 [Gossypium raimondii]
MHSKSMDQHKQIRCRALTRPPILFLHSYFHFNYSLLLQEQALLECDNDIDTAIKRLEDLCLGAAEGRGEKTCPVEELGTTAEQGILTNNGESVAAAAAVTIQNQSASENMPADVLENSISKRAAEETAQNFQEVLSLNHLWISIYHSFSRLARGPANV